MASNVTHQFTITIEAVITGTPIPYRPAKIDGDPDSCYPAEGGEVEDMQVCIVGRCKDGKSIKFDVTSTLSSDELDEIEHKFMEAMGDDAETAGDWRDCCFDDEDERR